MDIQTPSKSAYLRSISAGNIQYKKPHLELANRLVQETKKRSQLPSYHGLDRFQIMKKIGDGAFSNVYAAREIGTDKKVAIKVAQKPKSDMNNSHLHLHSSLKKKPKTTERASILKEVQIMRNIRHPNIVQLVHYTETSHNYFLTMELCEGGELFHQIVKLTYFSEELSRHVMTQVASAVKYLHEECGVVHRDIKPENILFEPIPIRPSRHRRLRPTDNENKLDEGEFIPGVGGGGIGRVKLADFGLSKVIWDNPTFTPCGTVGYTAPEIVCTKKYSKSVDMWAMGCVLYTILCGFPPFYDESIQNLTDKVARGQFTFLSPWWDTMSVKVKHLIQHLLCVDSSQRLSIDGFLSHPWMRSRQEPEKDPRRMVRMESNYSTPDAATLREIFDVTYAVQRMGEEYPQKQEEQRPQRHVPVPITLQNHHLPFAQKLAQNSRGVADPTSYPYRPYPVEHAVMPSAPKQGFHLDMDKATLIKNRKTPFQSVVEY
ncbi:kinase-like domain-containing protein [Sporodiniella umbellata]|nr:kinase-like domain-containing protein [Sporodiniella umbellata]